LKFAAWTFFAGVVALSSACNLIIGADEPERRQDGEPCMIPRDCADGLLCIAMKCGKQSPEGGPCNDAGQCSTAGNVCVNCTCYPCSGPSCADFTDCGRSCNDTCGLREPCRADADCDPKKGLVCDTEHGECVIPDCKLGAGDFVCGPPQCADFCLWEECQANQCTTNNCKPDVAAGLACTGAGSRCGCVPP
jgi:hypothetical protein